MDVDAITNLLISLVAGLAGVVLILLRAEIKQLRAELNGFRAEMSGRFDAVIATQKEHGERLARLETLVEFLIGPFRSIATDSKADEQAMLAFRGHAPDEAEEA